MGRIFERSSAYAGLGSVIGGAIGTLLVGTTIALPGVNIVVAPLVAAAATTITVSGSAAGTLIGATAGAISGARENAAERRKD